MPKSAQSTLRWEPLQAKYLIIERENGASDFLSEDEADFLAFVEHHRAFAFHGRSGHLNLFKEQRRGRGEGYWYAYQRHNRRVRKHYVGRSAQMNLEYLEELASQMAQKPKTKPTFLSVAQTDQRSVQRRMLESGSTQETTRKTSEQAKNLLPMESAGEDASHAPLEPLLLPKLELPRRKPGFLPREPLLKLLDAGLSHKVTLVAGPAGYGKTTLIGQWIAARRKHADFPLVASVILDEGDNDPIRFWRYLITACQQFKAGLGKAALQWLHAYHLPSLKPLDLMLTVLLNELSQLEHPGILILDDLHTINSPQVIETLSFFLDHLPTPIHLVLLGRGDPPFLAARLRARHELLRIAPFSLRFSLEETSAFLAQALPFVPSSRNVRQIHERLEGWPAGLRFLVEILRWSEQGGDIEHILSTFSGSALSVQEYFLSEILHTLPEEQQTFLLHTCMLPLLTAPLCDTITERGESARQLEALHRGDFFLLPLDPAGEWARYYPLFGEALQQEAQRCLGEARLRELATRASQWYEAHELLPEAIEIALYAATYTRAADLLALLLERQQRANGPGAWELYRVKRWLERLPQAEVEQNPDLCVHAALHLFFLVLEEAGGLAGKERIDHLLQVAEEHWRNTNTTAKLAKIFAFRALLARQEGNPPQAATWARQALAWLPQEGSTWRILALTAVGLGELHDGTLASAHDYFLEALRLNEQQGNPIGIRATRDRLSQVSFEQGELRQAAEQWHQIQAEARSVSDRDDIARTQVGLAQLAYQWNDLEGAEQAAHEALALSEQLNREEVQAQALMPLARIAQRRGQTAQMQQRLTGWLAQRQARISPLIAREVQVQLVRMHLADNDLATVRHWFEHHVGHAENLTRSQRQCEHVLWARLLLAQGETSEAIERLEHACAETSQTGHLHFRREIQAVLAVAHARQGAHKKAQELLMELLKTTRSQGYLRLFLDEGEELVNLLRDLFPLLREKALPAYVQRILNTFARESGMLASETAAHSMLPQTPLSPQEQKVLRLLAAGHSNAEIANALVVSVNTVRTQLQSIYRKLNVNNRVQASVIANQLDLK